MSSDNMAKLESSYGQRYQVADGQVNQVNLSQGEVRSTMNNDMERRSQGSSAKKQSEF